MLSVRVVGRVGDEQQCAGCKPAHEQGGSPVIAQGCSDGSKAHRRILRQATVQPLELLSKRRENDVVNAGFVQWLPKHESLPADERNPWIDLSERDQQAENLRRRIRPLTLRQLQSSLEHGWITDEEGVLREQLEPLEVPLIRCIPDRSRNIGHGFRRTTLKVRVLPPARQRRRNYAVAIRLNSLSVRREPQHAEWQEQDQAPHGRDLHWSLGLKSNLQ